MKNFGQIIRNLYRITIAKPMGVRSDNFVSIDEQNISDSYIKSAIKNDPLDLEPDPEIYTMLVSRVASKNKQVKENSFFILPAFSLKNIELKMAAISLIFVILLGINPSAQFQVNRKISPFSLADTLIDSSKLEKPYYNLINKQD